MLEPHATWRPQQPQWLLHISAQWADHVQPATGCLPFTIVPPGPFLSQTFTPNVSFLVTDNLVTISLSSGKACGFLRTQHRQELWGSWPRPDGRKQLPWDDTVVKSLHLDVTASPTRVICHQMPQSQPWGPAPSPGRAVTLWRSSYHWQWCSSLLTGAVVALCVWLLPKAERAKPLTKLPGST